LPIIVLILDPHLARAVLDHAAEEDRRLDEERVKVGIEIRDAGNDAIHDLQRFRKGIFGTHARYRGQHS
jgi:hypothetical protein